MRRSTPSLLAASALAAWLAGVPAHAQTPSGSPTAPASTAPADTPRAAPGPGDRIERIRHEDALTRIDEVRVGGQTQSIDVQPKNGAPAYQVAPASGANAPGETGGRATGNAGRSSWRLMNF